MGCRKLDKGERAHMASEHKKEAERTNCSRRNIPLQKPAQSPSCAARWANCIYLLPDTPANIRTDA